jgi:hypothetical protein
VAKHNYLISGIGPGPGGVGALMKNLGPIAKKRGFRVIAKWNGPSIRKLLNQRRYAQVAKLVALRLFNRIRFYLVANSARGSKVIFLHPQTAGFKTLFRLVQKCEVFLYVMDNSFFCMRSYNFHPDDKAECLKCIGDAGNADEKCTAFPAAMDREENIALLKKLREIAPRISFLCQNKSQSQLLKMHFGDNIRCITIGMNTGELRNWSPKELYTSKDHTEKPFILFHGAAADSKGLDYVIRLAEQMPHREFIVPAPERELEHRIVPKNIVCCDVTWASGLLNLVQEASLVINPSMWSAPIEGALIKSLAYNWNVASVKTEYGYESEIPDSVGLLRLPQDVEQAAYVIDQYLLMNKISKTLRRSRIEWLERIKSENQFENFLTSLLENE